MSYKLIIRKKVIKFLNKRDFKDKKNIDSKFKIFQIQIFVDFITNNYRFISKIL